MATAVETPSKAAATALSSINLNTLKPLEGSLLAKLKEAAAEKPVIKDIVLPVTKEEDVEAYRKRFVGDVDCEEKNEPLLQETTSRFVLFPIKYREVSYTP
jgi:ribonucleoside-diphosphate reductase subunit M2